MEVALAAASDRSASWYAGRGFAATTGTPSGPTARTVSARIITNTTAQTSTAGSQDNVFIMGMNVPPCVAPPRRKYASPPGGRSSDAIMFFLKFVVRQPGSKLRANLSLSTRPTSIWVTCEGKSGFGANCGCEFTYSRCLPSSTLSQIPMLGITMFDFAASPYPTVDLDRYEYPTAIIISYPFFFPVRSAVS